MDDYEKYLAGLRARAEAERPARQQGRELSESGKEGPDYHTRTRGQFSHERRVGRWRHLGRKVEVTP